MKSTLSKRAGNPSTQCSSRTGDSPMEPAFRLCESHPGRFLTAHLLDVASRLQRYGPLCRLTGLFHDLGKATRFFQEYLHDQATDPRLKQHAQLGALWLMETLLSSDFREPG